MMVMMTREEGREEEEKTGRKTNSWNAQTQRKAKKNLSVCLSPHLCKLRAVSCNISASSVEVGIIGTGLKVSGTDNY